jgi:hypothetical protein|tara:strand:- start:5014 stop:5229 length:216 start_codon:yes stop_codon:yes gene_type:complete
MTDEELQQLYGKLMKTDEAWVELPAKLIRRVITELLMRRNKTWEEGWVPGSRNGHDTVRIDMPDIQGQEST